MSPRVSTACSAHKPNRDFPKQTLVSSEQKHPHTLYTHFHLVSTHGDRSSSSSQANTCRSNKRLSCRANQGVELRAGKQSQAAAPVGVRESATSHLLNCVCAYMCLLACLHVCLLIGMDKSVMFALLACLTAVSQLKPSLQVRPFSSTE